MSFVSPLLLRASTNTFVQMNIPHLVFVASTDIPAFIEITIDYKQTSSNAQIKCMCKSPGCRNFC